MSDNGIIDYNEGNWELKMKTAEKLEKRVSFRMTESENQQLNNISKLLGCRPSDTLRLALTSMNMAAEEYKNAI